MMYILRNYGYEHNIEHIFEGPEVESFQELCDSLLDELEPKPFMYSVRSLVDILISRGYKQIKLETAEYFTDCGWPLNDTEEEIQREIKELMSLNTSISYKTAEKMVSRKEEDETTNDD